MRNWSGQKGHYLFSLYEEVLEFLHKPGKQSCIQKFLGGLMKLFFIPWIAPISLLVLFISTLVSTLIVSPTSTDFVFYFLYSIYFHILALAFYIISLYFILKEAGWKRIIIATVNCSVSLLIWFFLINLISADFNFVA